MSGTDEMRDLLNRLYDSFGTGDAAAWTAAVTEDVLGVGSDPDEWWEGRDAFVSVVTLQVEQMAAANVQVSPGTPHIFEQGDVVWAVDRPTISSPDGTATQTRLTIVASRQAGELQIRHFHLSVGVPNEEHVGLELPTS
jgi:ketosteroid isomerase-like protein